MNCFTVNIKFSKSQQERIYIPSFLIQKLNIKNNQRMPIYFGLTKKSMVLISSIKSDKNEILMTTALKNSLSFPFKKNLLLKRESDGLRLGPIIGILTTDITGKKFSNPATSAYHPHSIFFKSLLKPGKSFPAFYFVFTPNNVNWNTQTIKGFSNIKNNSITNWQTIEFPLPDVVYNRIPNRTIEKKEIVQNFKHNYLQIGGKMFNYDFYNKWDVYQILSNDSFCYKYAPETLLNPSLTDFNELISRHPLIYLKPANGSLGLGIFKIERLDNTYYVKYRLGSKNISLTFKNINSIYKYIFSKKSSKNYLLQQGINLIDYQNSPVDFRVQLHKDQHNQWQVTAIGAKAADKDSVTTHLRTGGKLLDSEKYLIYKFNNQAKNLINKIKSSSIEIVKTIEKNTDSPIGELGLDIGIDNKQNIWLFEVNSKPGRSIFKHPSLKTALNNSNNLLLQYSTYLAGFNFEKPNLTEGVM
ncbi:MAG: YheC/YheD family protein [Vulcanibacillus sp.]